MEPLPKIARDRLRANPPAQHPDADLLTAFAEHSLSGRERAEVADHLARCGECRQVVAMAVPAFEPALAAAAAHARAAGLPSQTAGAKPSLGKRRFWLASPVLRWGALAACIVVVGAAVLNYRRTSRMESYTPVAAREVKSEAARLQQASPGAPGSRDLAANSVKAAPKANSRPTLAAKPSREKTQDSGSTGTASKLESRRRFDEMAVGKAAGAREETIIVEADKNAPLSQSPAAAHQVPSAPPPPAPSERAQEAKDQTITGGAAKQNVEVAGASSEVETQAAGYLKKRKLGDEKEDGRMKTTVARPSTTFSARINDAAANEGLIRPAKWSLSLGGLPQRSFDSGVTWQEMPVDQASGFRALSALGQEVWVGGTAGLLYHSSDNGMHWVRVIPTAGGVALQADITRIEFIDALHGRLSAADGATWTTSDGGKTWQKN